MTKVLVTGATGFVGRHLCPALVKAGYIVRALHSKNEFQQTTQDGIEWVKTERINSDTDWSAALSGGISHVVHLAAVAHRIDSKGQIPDAIYDQVNHLGTAQLARASAHTASVKRFLFVSSIGAVASLSEERINEQTTPQPDSAYGRSKLAGENAVQGIFSSTQADFCILRPPLMYGPDNPGNMARFLRLLRLGLPLPLGSVRNRRTFLYIGNFVSSILVAMEHPSASRRLFCLGETRDVSTPELLRALAKVCGLNVRLFPFPIGGLRLAGVLMEAFGGQSFGLDRVAVDKLCGSLFVDGSLFRTVCGWQAPCSFEDGLRSTVQITENDHQSAGRLSL